jgi:hypothetical protein
VIRSLALAFCTATLITNQVRADTADAGNITQNIALVQLYDRYCTPVSLLVKERLTSTALIVGITAKQVESAKAGYLPMLSQAGTDAFCTAAKLTIVGPLEDRAKYGSSNR